MKKVFFSSLMVFALSTMAFAQQSKQPSKPMQSQSSQPTTQQPSTSTQSSTQANQSTEKKSTTMAKPRHRKAHKAKKHHTTTK